MKIYKSSALSNNRSEVMREAEKGGVIIQECRTNGDVVMEFVLTTKSDCDELDNIAKLEGCE